MDKYKYIWRGIDRHGQAVKGESHGDDKAQVIQQLRQQRIRATRIERQWSAMSWLRLERQPTLHKRDITRLTRQLATLLKAGVPLLQSLDILEKGETHVVLKTLISDIHAQIERGLALHQALQRHVVFDTLYCNLVAVGEITGMLDIMLERLAHHLEKSENLQRVLRSALLYPCVVLAVAGIVLSVILVFVVPAFQSIFASFGAELPWLTRWVIAVSEWVQRYGWIATVAVAGSGWCLKLQFQKRPHWQAHLHRVWLHVPIAGALTRHACTARWTRTLATLFAAGIPLTEALESLKTVTGHRSFQTATEAIQAKLMRGISLSQALDQTQGLFPPMLIQMCAIGEDSGALDHMLEKTAEHYEQDVDNTVARLSTLLEPFIMVVLGVLIGGLVMALYLPIFQLGQVV
jgi:type IV pilus assembly protein PilC